MVGGNYCNLLNKDYCDKQSVLDSINKLTPLEKIYLEKYNNELFQACEKYKINMYEGLTGESVVSEVMSRKFKNLKNLKSNDPKLAEVIKDKNLETIVYTLLETRNLINEAKKPYRIKK